MANPYHLITGDSPKWGFVRTDQTAKETETFQMYLLWRFGDDPGDDESPDSIWVPLRVTNWEWSFTAHKGGGPTTLGNWKLDTWNPVAAADPGPPSKDTTDFPRWTRRLNMSDPEMLDWRDDL